MVTSVMYSFDIWGVPKILCAIEHGEGLGDNLTFMHKWPFFFFFRLLTSTDGELQVILDLRETWGY